MARRAAIGFLVGLLLAAAAAADDPRTRDYAAIDQWALQTPVAETATLEGLAHYLVRPARDDFDKARALFRWITANIHYDVEAFLSGRRSGVSAADTLRHGRSVCQGYANLFQQMGEAVGLRVVTISGWAKGYNHVPGEELGETNHAWNAVQVGAEWYLLDSTWGAGYVSAARQYVPKFDDFYFLTPPEQFVRRHLPEEERWQLLDPPLTAEAFRAGIAGEPALFRLGLAPESHREEIIRTGPDLNLVFMAPENTFMLVQAKDGDTNIFPQAIPGTREGERLRFALRLPPGEHELRCYGRRDNPYGSYECVLSYKVIVTAGG